VVVIERESRHNGNMLSSAVTRRPLIGEELPSGGWPRGENEEFWKSNRSQDLAHAGYRSTDNISKKKPKWD